MDLITTEVVVLGAGPGGYAAAFYAADLGKKVILVEQDKRLGGVCLNRGCIPSKALLHATHLVTAAKESSHRGITFTDPTIDVDKLRTWKEGILDRLSGGIGSLAKMRKVDVWNGRGHFEDSNTLRVETEEGQKFIRFEQAIIATGSKAAIPKAFDLGNPRIMTSTEALNIQDIPQSLLVVGGGYIGMELGTVYASLGSKVVVVELMESLLMGADPDLVRPIFTYAKKNFSEVCDDLGLENTRVKRTDKGFISVNDKQQTDDPSIYCIGDAAGGIMLAHKATREARIAVEVINGSYAGPDGFVIPAVVFTDPELAWCGLTESEAKAKNIPVEVAKFPWGASGRALTFDRPEGITKLIIDPETERILGVGIVGQGAGELIAEGVLAVEMGATAKDLALSVHPHPTLSETIMECAEAFYGHATHTFVRKKS
jgi:dihydrolipoamide dehydrogenase